MARVTFGRFSRSTIRETEIRYADQEVVVVESCGGSGARTKNTVRVSKVAENGGGGAGGRWCEITSSARFR